MSSVDEALQRLATATPPVTWEAFLTALADLPPAPLPAEVLDALLAGLAEGAPALDWSPDHELPSLEPAEALGWRPSRISLPVMSEVIPVTVE